MNKKNVSVYFSIVTLAVSLLTVLGLSLEFPVILTMGIDILVITWIRDWYFKNYFK